MPKRHWGFRKTSDVLYDLSKQSCLGRVHKGVVQRKRAQSLKQSLERLLSPQVASKIVDVRIGQHGLVTLSLTEKGVYQGVLANRLQLEKELRCEFGWLHGIHVKQIK